MTREEAISLIKSAQLMLINPTTNEPVSDLYAALDMAIQALSQEPKSGKWIDINGIYAECSNCNEEIYITGDFNYCPNCGAKMVESQESEEV